MSRLVHGRFGTNTAVLLALIAAWSISHADDASVAGAYSLVEVNGEALPAKLWVERPGGERCEQIILKGALLLDSEGRSAAFLTEKVSCPSAADQEIAGEAHSVIFPGTYTVSGTEISIEDDFGTDRAVVEGETLVYETGGEGRPLDKFVFRKE